jgi:hypothetical protein
MMRATQSSLGTALSFTQQAPASLSTAMSFSAASQSSPVLSTQQDLLSSPSLRSRLLSAAPPRSVLLTLLDEADDNFDTFHRAAESPADVIASDNQ